jgi:hypothetical protein
LLTLLFFYLLYGEANCNLQGQFSTPSSILSTRGQPEGGGGIGGGGVAGAGVGAAAMPGAMAGGASVGGGGGGGAGPLALHSVIPSVLKNKRSTVIQYYGCIYVSYVEPQHCKENPIHVFLFWELRGLSLNFHIHVSVSYLYISRIGGPHIWLQQNR